MTITTSYTKKLTDPCWPREGRVSAARWVARTGTERRVLVSSFNPLALARWKARRPDVPAGLLFERGAPLPLRRAWALRWLRPFAVHPEQVFCTPERVAGWHAAGYAVNAWTVDEPERLRALAAAGVDGVITNDPAAARAALGS